MYYIIINPSSKSGRGVKIWNQLEPIFSRNNIPYRVLYSEYSGHIIKLVNDLSDPLKSSEHVKLIVVGGDGTMNEVLQGIMDWNKVSIGYIPTGSSNDFARALKFPKDPVKQLEKILESKEDTCLDVGVITYLDAVDENGNPETVSRRFDVSCGIGFDAAVCEEAMHGSNSKKLLNKLKLGKLTYLAIALKHLLSDTGVSISYSLDGQAPINLKRFLFIAIMQNKYEGGGFMFCPDANPSDGKLDLCVVGSVTKSKILRAIPLAFVGKHLLFKGISAHQAQTVRIKTTGDLWVHTDGEVHRKSHDFLVETLNGKLHMML